MGELVQRVTSLLGISILLLLSGCGIPQADFEKIKTQNESLKLEIDDLKNGESRLVATIDKAYSEKNYGLAKTNIELLNLKHPESNKNAEYKPMLVEISKFEAAESVKKDADEKERIRLSNLDNTGIWQVNFYVDGFGEKTKTKFIANTEAIRGTFSNTATQDTKLNAFLLSNGPSSISIKLFEYAGRNPVKAVSTTRYDVRVKDKDGQKYELSATNDSDRLTLGEHDSKILHNALMKGGQVQLWIQEVERPSSQYQFTIDKADWYDNAYQKFVSN